jgi:hypothetical protein
MSEHVNETLMQLFLYGPVWDGNLVSKSERDGLHDAGLIERGDGWQWLTAAGVSLALKADVRHWHDKRWFKKQAGA